MTTFLFALLSIFTLNTENTTLALDLTKGREAKIVHYGAKLDDPESVMDADYQAQILYPAYGLIGTDAAAIAVTQPDGNVTLDLETTDWNLGKWEGGELLTITMQDRFYPVIVRIFYKSFVQEDMFETWTEITNEGNEPVILRRFDSGHLPIRGGDTWISTIYGTWANEGRVSTEPLARGYRVIRNIDGTRNSHTSHAEAMISLDGKPQEQSGRVIGAALCWGGNYELRFQKNDSDFDHFFAGIDSENAEYHLEGGETFRTPELALTFSNKGLGGASRNFHRWGRKYRLMHPDHERDILLNSWEGVYFDINEAGMQQMMADIAAMGGELFVMDDGWFGGKYQRNSDNSSLGDWVTDTRKLPRGIGWLVSQAASKGIKFGIWLEPEMTNTTSELYEKHPDWVLGAANRRTVTGRGGTQLVLDLCNPEVRDFIFGVVDGLMTKYPDIAYIKWDSNMNIPSHGSPYLEQQSHLNIEYWRGLAEVLDRIRAKYPGLVIQDCASGGGRANWGVLPWFDEFWCSDNTDALQRIYMQWGTSFFFPAIAMASHISATPNHMVFRTTSLKYRIDVAMSGRLGMEIQPANMSAEEKELCRKAIADYKRIRPVVQFGDLWRLVSPYEDKGFASLMYTSEDLGKAVFYWWKIANFYDEHFPRVKMAGLDPDRRYRITELNRIDLDPLPYEGKVFSGRFLMENGLDIPLTNETAWSEKTDWSSRVLLLEAQ